MSLINYTYFYCYNEKTFHFIINLIDQQILLKTLSNCSWDYELWNLSQEFQYYSIIVNENEFSIYASFKSSIILDEFYKHLLNLQIHIVSCFMDSQRKTGFFKNNVNLTFFHSFYQIDEFIDNQHFLTNDTSRILTHILTYYSRKINTKNYYREKLCPFIK